MTRVSAEDAACRMREVGIIAIVRGDYSLSQLRDIADVLEEGGVGVMEVTLNSTSALECIAALRSFAGNRLLVGAGTVRTPEDVDRALEAGAQFLVSPNFDPESAFCAIDAGVLHLPGVFTASEAQQALRAGCRMQKLFPAGQLGPSYLEALRAPLGDIEFVPTGGIDAGNVAAFVRAGAVALGIGSALVAGPRQDLSALRQRVEQLTSVLQAARLEYRMPV